VHERENIVIVEVVVGGRKIYISP